MTEVALYKVERGRIKGSLTKLKTFVDSITTDKPAEEIEARLEKLEELAKEFKIVDDKLAVLNVESEYSAFEHKYLEIKIALRRHINHLATKMRDRDAASTHNEFNSTMNKFVEQQKVDIPPFSGDYKDWRSFKDLFISSIDKKEGIPSVHKLQYLKSLLKGEAAAVIKHLPITESNYHEAWSKLMKRYDKRKQIVSAYIKAFINQPNFSQLSAASLRRLADTSDQLIRGIKVLGQEASGRDPWLIYLILNKTDADTRKAWAEHTTSDEFPSFETFLDFLSTRCDALEAFDPIAKKHSNIQPIRNLHADTITRCIKCLEAHPLFKCPEYKAMDIIARRNFVSKNSLCFNCLSSGHAAQKCNSKFKCHHCKKSHYSTLHSKDTPKSTSHTVLSTQLQLETNTSSSNPPADTLNPTAPAFNSVGTNPPAGSQSHFDSYAIFNEKQSRLTILPTALVYISDASGSQQLCRALLDSGSQASFISEHCVHRLGLQRDKAKIIIHGLSSAATAITRGVLTLSLFSRFSSNHHLSVRAYILDKLTAPQPARSFSVEHWKLIKNYSMADPQFYESRKIDIILGADHFIQILQDGRIHISSEVPPLQNTIFGYIVSGPVTIQEKSCITSLHSDVTDIDASLRKFWEIEELSIPNKNYTQEEEHCEALFATTYSIDPTTNRYVVRLPFKKDAPSLGESLSVAISRFNVIERKLQRDTHLHDEYLKFMAEYKDLQHLECIPAAFLSSPAEHAYLPHHAVRKPSSTTTKVRVVFNGSSPTSTGTSLNQKLLVGPKVQRDLVPILLSFRSFKVAVVADIEKMYRQILVHEEDRNYQRIVWRNHPSQPLPHLWLTTVTYGTASAPFLATRALNQLTIEFQGRFPLAERALQNNFYVDDLLGGASNETEALQLYTQLTSLLRLRGFSLRKWASNSQQFLKSIPVIECNSTIREIDEHEEGLKVLGLKWIPSEDCFTFEVALSECSAPTKRIILSESSRIFDPLGLVSPVTITFKILLQQLWLKKYDWDDVCEEIGEKWKKLRNDLNCLQDLRIPRYLHSSSLRVELHGFSDASESAYAAVIYCRSEDADLNVHTTIVAAKTKVCPIKQVSIPRLELCAAVLLSNLIAFVRSTLNIPTHQCFGWTDSTVVLAWLSAHPRKWNCFIGNRTSFILSILPRQHWSHVSSTDNPADLASRGLYSRELVHSSLWWHGPPWLKCDWKIHTNEIISQGDNPTANEERRERYLDVFLNEIINETLYSLFKKHSSLARIIRIISRCFQFVRNCRATKDNKSSWITTADINKAFRSCILWTQDEAFRKEIQSLQSKQSVSSSSRIVTLSPFLDSSNILRVGGRLDNSKASYDSKHPVILPKHHIFVQYLIRYLHAKHLHAGTSLLLSICRQKYWILSCRSAVKAYINKCVSCVRQRAATSQQLMASLPRHRVGAYRPFENVGVDCAGPLSLLVRRGRGAKTTKGYIALFVCFSTRAINLELAGDLTSDTFIACLKRFISRRGIPTNIFSDNGTNFVGAKRQLKEIQKSISSMYKNTLIQHFLSSNRISWNFNPPAAPHFGGIWEAGVRSVKTILRRTIGETKLTYEEMNTLLVQVKGLLNSRPLTPISDDITSLDALTPAHFLTGQPITALPEVPVNRPPSSLVGRWRLLQHMHQHFWRRWHLEYLSTLQQRPKWYNIERNFAVGDMVIVKDNNFPPAKWILGRITATHPGADNLVRVVTVRTAHGDIKRPIIKLCKLPITHS